MANNAKRFLTMSTGTTVAKDGAKIPYAFHVEANVASNNGFRAGDGDKPSILNLSVGVGRNPWILLGQDAVAEQSGNPDINEDAPFVQLAIFGKEAERLRDIQKGAKIVFSGRPEINRYKKKATGEDAAAVRVFVDNIYQLASRSGTADDVRTTVSSRENYYESRGKTGSQRLGMISGKVISAENLRTTSTGKEVISAKLELAIPALQAEALINGTYSKDAQYGNFKQVTISVWGARATHMDRILVPGNKLVITGSASTNEGKDGRKYVNVSVRDLSVLEWATPAPAAPADAPAVPATPAETASTPFDELDDYSGMDLPF